jgi:poly-gamma-glutamate synthesis protein (capsule biosynthesis protein)
MSIVIGADIVPSPSNSNLFTKGDVDTLVGHDLVQILNEADYRVFNLETPLVDDDSPIDKCGPSLRADCSTVNAIKKLDVNLLTMANNHVMDQGVRGLTSTTQTLKENGISYFGVGENLKNVSKSHVVNINGKKFGFYACVEHEFSVADEHAPGANPLDPLESFDHVISLKEQCDFVIVLYHGGKEYYQYPSPMLQKVCRKFIEKGANLVVCQHSHCIGCEEKYGSGTIVYGQGNFIFDKIKNPLAQTSLLVKVNDDLSIRYIPLTKVEKGVRLAVGNDAETIMTAFRNRSEQIKEDGFVTKEYKKFSSSMLKRYLLACSGYNHSMLRKILNRLTGGLVSKRIANSYNKKDLLAIRNYLECEAHRELWVEGLKNAID